jgi:hypothetical protein
MFKNNPMKNAIIKKRMIEKLIKNSSLKKIQPGGNGQSIPIPQKMVADLLGWETEYILTTTQETRLIFHCPYHYKLDVANPKEKIAIEVDGYSHNTILAKIRDKRKEEVLKTLGWRIIRIKNQDVLRALGPA